MLRHADINTLLMGHRPDFGLVGFVLAMFFIAIPTTIHFIIGRYLLSPVAGMLVIILTSVSCMILLLHLSKRQFGRVG